MSRLRPRLRPPVPPDSSERRAPDTSRSSARAILSFRGAARQAILPLVALAACTGDPPTPAASPLHQALLREETVRLEIATALGRPGEPVLRERMREPDALTSFYAGRGYQPAWLHPDGAASANASALLASVADAGRHGLAPAAYHAGALARIGGASAVGLEDIAELDVLASDAFLHLARHLSSGAVDPRLLHSRYERAGSTPDPSEALATALATGGIRETLELLAPPHPEYAALVRALERLRAAAGVGDAAAAASADTVRANLERWRWLPRDLGRRHLRVNTPTFTLDAFDAGARALSMRVVVGEIGWKTPLAHGVISHLVLNPAWQVPRSIATREMLPAARRDSGYFAAHDIQVLVDEDGEPREIDSASIDWQAVTEERFPFRLRQPPGPRNPLGRIKFVFRTPYDVYLHGTPTAAAFQCPERALSHGCIRVEDEIALALFALAPDPSWSRERLLASLGEVSEGRLALPLPLPVHLLYFTASADAEGSASFTGDPYGWDRALIGALASIGG